MVPSRHKFALALVSGLPFISAIFVGLRMFARYRRRLQYGWDDWLLVLATLFSISLIAPSMENIRMFHMGYHIWEVGVPTSELEPDFGEYYRVLLMRNLLNIPILPLAKASIILLLLKVGTIIPAVRRCLYAVFAFNLGACVIPLLLFIFICPPRTGNTWAPETFGGLQCLGYDKWGRLLVFVNCANLLTDVLIFPIPFFIMRELMHTDRRARITIILTFASSICVTVLSAVKIYVTYRDRIIRTDVADWTYSIEYCANHGESNVGIIVACIPTLRGLFTQGFRSTTADMEQTSSYTSGARSRPSRFRSGLCSNPRAPSPVFLNGHVLKSPEPPITALPEDEPLAARSSKKPSPAVDDDGSGSSMTEFLIMHDQHAFNATPALPLARLRR